MDGKDNPDTIKIIKKGMCVWVCVCINNCNVPPFVIPQACYALLETGGPSI